VPERRVLAVVDEREPALREREAVDRGERHLPQAGHLRASGQHRPTLTWAGPGSNRRLETGQQAITAGTARP
jgi:hypothetical protein